MESENKSDLEQWLERALHEYGNAEPQAGLEIRILARLELVQPDFAWRRGWWVLVAAGVTAAVIIVVWFGHDKNGHDQVHTNFARKAISISQQTGQSDAHSEAKRVVAKNKMHRPMPPRYRKAIEVAQSPKLSQFPSPQPLSEQDRWLARYVKEFPDEAIEVARAQAHAEAQKELEELAADKYWDTNSDQDEK
jgi:hypothetical protein